GLLGLIAERRGGGGLSGAVGADERKHERAAIGTRAASIEPALTAGEHTLENRGANFGGLASLHSRILAVGLFDLVENLLGRLHAKIRRVQGLLEFIERRCIDLPSSEQ